MAIATFRKLCVDTKDPARLGAFWSGVLDRRWEPDEKGEGGVFGPTRGHTVWFNLVPEPKTVKHRVHFDVYAIDVAWLQELGSRVLVPEGAARPWTVMADPEGGEYCAFLRDVLPADRMHGLVVDSADPASQARWWAWAYDAEVVDDEHGFSTVQNVPGMPILTMDFVPVPEPKTVKNRIHWDVTVADPEPLLDAGATMLRRADDEVPFHVLADPEGNEFCAMPYA